MSKIMICLERFDGFAALARDSTASARHFAAAFPIASNPSLPELV